MTELYDAFMSDLIHERERSLTECDNNIIAEFLYDNTDDIVKKEDVDCCVCLTTRRGFQLPNCAHFVCCRCHYKMHNGFISDTFHNTHRRPWFHLEKPEYPYKDSDQTELLSIYRTLTDNNAYEHWFVNANEDLYITIRKNEEFVKSLIVIPSMCDTNTQIFDSIKEWFIMDQKIQQYDSALMQFYNEYKLFEAQENLYDRLYEAERKKNSMKRCPLCRS